VDDLFKTAENKYKFSLPLSLETAQQFQRQIEADERRKQMNKAKSQRPKSAKQVMKISKDMHAQVVEICNQKYGKDERYKPKFIELGMRLVRTGELN